MEAFDPTTSTSVEHSCDFVLRAHGVQFFAAATEASEKAPRVLAILRSKPPEELPFEFSDDVSDRLVGKQRARAGDSPQTIAARQGFALAPHMLAAIYGSGDVAFEKVCAAIMRLSGATEAFASCASDDGGIDVYGRIPLGLNDDRVKSGILSTAIVQMSMFFLGQCKCYSPSEVIGPAQIREFYGSVEACRNKYEHNPKPPRHRVPDSYYKRGETSISILFSTGTFSEKAVAAAEADGIVLVTGRQIAQFLVHHRVVIIEREDGTLAVDGNALEAWATRLIQTNVQA